MLEEAPYRQLVQSTFERILQSFDPIDPDVAEAELQMGALTVILADGARCILSAQPSVRQIWLALASKGIGHHFNYDEATRTWQDDKGKGLELISFLKDFFQTNAGIRLELSN